MIINNKFGCTVIGRIARDIDSKTFDSGRNKINFSVIYGQSEEKDEKGRAKALFMDIDVWGDYASDCMWMQKGDNVCVTGRISKREYNGKEYVTLTADSVIPDAPSIYRMIGKMAVNSARAASDEPVQFEPMPDIDDESLPF